jgi:peptidoglycan/xylan/chitin deacetylase (PgdA/CDA1 family)
MESEFSRPKKGKMKKKLKLFRTLTFVFALLLIFALGFVLFTSISSSQEINLLKKQIDDLRNNLTEMTNERISFQSEITTLTSENETLRTDYEKLNADTQEYQTTVTSLQSQIEQLTKDKSDLSAEISEISKDLETVRSTNKSLSERNAELSRQIASQKQSSSSSESKKVAYLTFDDGVSKYTNEILDILARYNVKATFFPNWKGNSDEKYKRIYDEGHAIGNHTYSHEYDDVYTSRDGFISEVNRLNEKIRQVTGYTPVIFRFPGGSNNTVHKNYNKDIMQQAISALSDLGMQYYDWNVNSGDADSSKGASKDTILSNVLARSTMDRAVILMHDTNTKGTTVAALPEIIEGLIAKGYSFGTLIDPDAPVIQSLKPAN